MNTHTSLLAAISKRELSPRFSVLWHFSHYATRSVTPQQMKTHIQNFLQQCDVIGAFHFFTIPALHLYLCIIAAQVLLQCLLSTAQCLLLIGIRHSWTCLVYLHKIPSFSTNFAPYSFNAAINSFHPSPFPSFLNSGQFHKLISLLGNTGTQFNFMRPSS